jgi:hypothetical protein
MTIPTQTPAETLTRLEALASELAARGWIARLHTPPGQIPALYVQNPDAEAAALCEYIYAAARADGTWTFWWPWAQALPPAIGEAADTIIRVLRATDAR